MQKVAKIRVEKLFLASVFRYEKALVDHNKERLGFWNKHTW